MHKSAAPRHPEVPIDPKQEVGLIIYSSGTTGLPKGVLLTQYAMVAHVLITRHVRFCETTCCNDTHCCQLNAWFERCVLRALGSDPRLKMVENVNFPSSPSYHIVGMLYLCGVIYARKTMILYTPTSAADHLLKAHECQVHFAIALI